MVNYNEKAIQEAAYYIWQNAGCPQGQDDQFWSMAVEQFKCCNKKAACASKPAACKAPAKAAPAKVAVKKVAVKK